MMMICSLPMTYHRIPPCSPMLLISIWHSMYLIDPCMYDHGGWSPGLTIELKLHGVVTMVLSSSLPTTYHRISPCSPIILITIWHNMYLIHPNMDYPAGWSHGLAIELKLHGVVTMVLSSSLPTTYHTIEPCSRIILITIWHNMHLIHPNVDYHAGWSPWLTIES